MCYLTDEIGTLMEVGKVVKELQSNEIGIIPEEAEYLLCLIETRLRVVLGMYMKWINLDASEVFEDE